MSYSPDYKENLADGVIKDLNIDNLRRLVIELKQIASEWVPIIEVDENALSNKGVEFKLIVKNNGVPQGCMLTHTNEDIIYLSEGDALVESVSSQLASLYEVKLRNLLRPEINKVLSNMKLRGIIK